MRILFDANALIHLIHGELLEVLLDLSGKTWFIGPLVLGECEQGGGIPVALQQAIDHEKISLQALAVRPFCISSNSMDLERERRSASHSVQLLIL